MSYNIIEVGRLFELLNINDLKSLHNVSKKLNMSTKDLYYYNDNMIIPTGKDMEKITLYTGYTKEEVELKLGYISPEVRKWISENADIILQKVGTKKIEKGNTQEVFDTKFGVLYNDDCLKVLKGIPDDSVDMVFADPPFNLNKDYGSLIEDNMSKLEYLHWCECWIKECVRVLKNGGTIFIYNLPYWNTYISNILNKYVNFRHWIAVSMKGLIPVQGKLHPEHYALLYYIKGEKPRTFNKQRIPLVTCRHCGGEIRDYGGKKSSLNPEGISVSDIFMDINPVRHKKYKNREANELPLNLLYRLIAMATNKGDTILDPFGGSGTTYVVAEYLKRKWIGMEIGNTDVIIERFRKYEKDCKLLKQIEAETNVLFTEEQVKLRKSNNFWTYEKLSDQKNNCI